ncbi:MAG: archaellin/type IV pilin N-terminal domain-containing protein [Conexivisphaera sp.]
MNFPMSAGGREPAGTKSKRAHRAISPIIATIILIVITVVAGAFLYVYATGMMKSGATAQQVNIQSSGLVVPNGAGSTGYLTVTLQNPGTVAVSNVYLTMFNGMPVNASTSGAEWINTIPPGGTASGSANVKLQVSSSVTSATYHSSTQTLDIPSTSTLTQLVAGQSYPVQLVVHYANGQTQTITTTITASSS